MFYRKCEHELWLVWAVVCTALIGPDLRSNAHSTSRVCVFFNCFSGRRLGIYGPQSNQQEELKCAFSTWWAWLELPLDGVLISAIGKIWGFEVIFYRCIFVSIQVQNFDSRPYLWTENDLFLKLVWVWFVKDSLRAFVWVAYLPLGRYLGFRAHIACLVDFFSCPRRRRFGAGGPIFSTIWSRLSRM
jgi:hypothetical protein